MQLQTELRQEFLKLLLAKLTNGFHSIFTSWLQDYPRPGFTIRFRREVLCCCVYYDSLSTSSDLNGTFSCRAASYLDLQTPSSQSVRKLPQIAQSRSRSPHEKRDLNGISMPLLKIDDLSDKRIEPFTEIRNRNWTERSGIFILEGPIPVRQLLSSSFRCKSLLFDEKYVDKIPPELDASIPVYVIEHALVEQVVGFRFHRGCLACGERKPLQTVDDLRKATACSPSTLAVALVGIQDPENLGSIIRSCAAFGAKNVLLGPGTADPFGRRALRVSMATSLELNFFRSDNLPLDLAKLRTTGCEIFGTSLDEDSEELSELSPKPGSPRLLIFGNERRGIPAEVLEQVDSKVRIGMQLNTDSLNVGVAAGIFLHHFSQMNNGRAN